MSLFNWGVVDIVRTVVSLVMEKMLRAMEIMVHWMVLNNQWDSVMSLTVVWQVSVFREVWISRRLM